MSVKILKQINIKQTQQHPFHVLQSSRLPFIMAGLSGCLALTFIAKLHNMDTDTLKTFSTLATILLDPFFSLGNMSTYSANLTILSLLVFLVLGM